MIAGRLPGRTDNEIKNYWNTHIRRKLLNRGIDPTTHRPLNENQTPTTPNSTNPNLDITTPANINSTTTISFSTTPSPEQQQSIIKTEQEQSGGGGGGITTKPNNMVVVQVKQEKEKCPDLNLDLKISPPVTSTTTSSSSFSTKSLCFACSLGLKNSKDCSCTGSGGGFIVVEHNGGINGATTTNTCYDFLGLKGGVLDYRGLEMK